MTIDENGKAIPEPVIWQNRFIDKFTTGVLILFLFMSFVVAYWWLYPYKPLEILNEPMNIVYPSSGVLHPGDLLTYHVDSCKNMNLVSSVTRSFVDGIKYDLPVVNTNNPLGCHELYPSIEIPDIPTGTYHLTILYQYQPNPIRTVNVVATTSAFLIANTDQ